jgi:VanZ family protein
LTRSLPTQGWRERISAYAPLLFWIGVIFYLSSSSGSFSETSRFIGPLLAFLFPDAAPETLTQYHGYIRKFAHIAVYLVLGFLALRTFGWRISRRFLKAAALSLALVLVIAALDEINQSFNTARTGTPGDVLLDAFGGLIGIGILGLWQKVRSN